MAPSIVAARRLPDRSRSRFPAAGLAFAARSAWLRRSSAWTSSLARWALARASVTLRELLTCFFAGVNADWAGAPGPFCAFFGLRGSFEYIALCLLWGFWRAWRQARGERVRGRVSRSCEGRMLRSRQG